jgi:hypothetical protein
MCSAFSIKHIGGRIYFFGIISQVSLMMKKCKKNPGASPRDQN